MNLNVVRFMYVLRIVRRIVLCPAVVNGIKIDEICTSAVVLHWYKFTLVVFLR